MPPIKTFRVPLGVTIIAIIASFILGGPEVGLIVVLLTILEISISFDNAIVNAHILKRMNEKWQQIFLTWGILIAVFGMRLVFPIVIVAAAAGLSIPDVLDQAFNEQELYAQNLEEANATIAAFGGMFLLMVFLNFFFDATRKGTGCRRSSVRSPASARSRRSPRRSPPPRCWSSPPSSRPR